MIKYVAYYRVSTKKQGHSGLGLEAQRRDIELYLTNYSNTPYTLLESFTDIDSGSLDNRPELTKAITLAKSEKAIILIAKLDRLSRKVSFIANLIEDKKIDFKVACMPNADKFQLQLYAVLAEQERDFISIRTKAALSEAKARGTKLGGLRDKTMARNKAIQKQATERANQLSGIITPLREQGISLQSIADNLNKLNYQTARGGKFTSMQVLRTIKRIKNKEITK
jgi:DNA invertase Pin-like site-specific DNA recombinase